MEHLNKPKVVDFAIRELTHGLFAVVAILDNGNENKLGIHKSFESAQKSLSSVRQFIGM